MWLKIWTYIYIVNIYPYYACNTEEIVTDSRLYTTVLLQSLYQFDSALSYFKEKRYINMYHNYCGPWAYGYVENPPSVKRWYSLNLTLLMALHWGRSIEDDIHRFSSTLPPRSHLYESICILFISIRCIPVIAFSVLLIFSL